MNSNETGDNQIVKFKISIQNSRQNAKEVNDVRKEKCGEIKISNYGIFEIECLLCGKYFMNVRNYTKHILYHHFQCNNDSTIHSFVEINQLSLDDLDDIGHRQILEDTDLISDGNNSKISNDIKTKTSSDAKTSYKIVEENEILEKVPTVTKMESAEYKVRDSVNLEKDGKSTNLLLDVTHHSLSEFRSSKNIGKNKSVMQMKSKIDNFESSEDESNENLDDNALEVQKQIKNDILEDRNCKNLKFSRSGSMSFLNEKPICKICGKQTTKYKMRQHLRSHDNSRYVHQCKICLKLFISEKSLNFHIKNLHTEEKPFICKINDCGKKYVSENALNAHVKRHGGRPFSCYICGKGFLYQSRLNEHVTQHIVKLRKETGLKPDEDNLQCPDEIKFDPSKKKKFKQKQVIKVQKKSRKLILSSKPAEKIICDVCGKETPKTNMKQHLRSHDSSRYTHKCDVCGKLFISEKSLDLHKKNLHIKNRPFACSFENCEKRFVNENALKSHVLRHTSPREYKCETCNKAFIYQYRLEEHIRMYHVNGRMFKCELCEKRFFDKHTLERHQIVHSGEKPFKCDECSAKFSRERSLQWHKKSHTGIKDYVCKICGKKYALYNGIYSHMKVHGIKYSMAYEKGLSNGKTEIDE